tara:strand:+ start:2041 stop:2214 length:174 start_codon:yes stop_codon:yes gene_type:complete
MKITIELEFYFEREEKLTESRLRDSVYTLLNDLIEKDDLFYTVEESKYENLILEAEK